MKKIIFSIFLTFLLSLHVSASFNTWFTNISWDATFKKNSWIDELRVSEDYIINPYEGMDIRKNTVICNWNACPCWPSGCLFTQSYSIDGIIFDPSHPLFKNFGHVRNNWYKYADGIDSRVEYRENTYTQSWGIYIPNQSVDVRRYYITTFKHDTTPPTCWVVNYFNDSSLSSSFTYTPGTWLNQPKYFTMTCFDAETDCYCDPSDSSCVISGANVVSTAQLLGHKIKPRVSFTNKVKLTAPACEPGGTFQEVLFDLRTPKIDINLGWNPFDLNLETLRVYDIELWKQLDGLEVPGRVEFTRTWSINLIAWNTLIDLELEDSFLSWSVHGVSGLKDYDFSITRLTDQLFNSITPQDITSCARSDVITNPYNPSGAIESTDLRNTSFTCNELTTAWKYSFTFIANDWAGNRSRAETIVNIYPDRISIPNSTISIDNPWAIRYANNLDSYDYEIDFRDQYWNPVFDRVITNPQQSIASYSLWETILLPDSTSGLRYDYPMSRTDNLWKYRFSVRALSPWNMTHRFLFNYKLWDVNYVQNSTTTPIFITNNTTGNFEKPFSANMVFLWPWDSAELWTEHDYRIDLTNDGGITWISNSNLDINSTSLNFTSWHRFSSITSLDNTFTLNDLQCSFTGIFDATSTSSVLAAPDINVDNMNVRYILAGKQISYPLNTFSLAWCSVSTVWLRTIGSTQWDWKWEISWGIENFSDISTSIYRWQVRQNAYSLIRGLNSWDIINWIRYIEGDVTISWSQSYETLIVKNWNVFISWDLNTTWNTFGIIVLKDSWFDVLTDYDNQWNVYVANTVEIINAQIYTDGTFRSATVAWIEYNDSLLGTKLQMRWSLFTRNTIGWWILAGSNYLLPWWSSTSDIELASLYDLNYIRRAQVCWEVDDYSFLIEYDPRIQTNPPAWFQSN